MLYTANIQFLTRICWHFLLPGKTDITELLLTLNKDSYMHIIIQFFTENLVDMLIGQREPYSGQTDGWTFGKPEGS